MYSKEKLLEMLASDKASTRYDACEWIRISQESSPEIINALVKASQDLDKEVAERAKLALEAHVHHQMAIKMGIIESDEAGEVPQLAENKEVNSKSRRIWGWILVIVGTLLVLCGLSFLSAIFLFVDPGNAAGGLFLGPPGLLIGLPLLVIGIRWIISGKRRSTDWGWVLSTVGGTFILLGLFWLFLHYALSPWMKPDTSDILMISGPLWLIGILLLIPGIWRITHKETTAPANPGGLEKT